ncbi:MAG TPA: Maf family nucleotide pyrophosphatase [Bacteroidales bacterium]|nr:Maf family nucleotide pyrophosphatase [Bacteroidales bacterium]
MPGDLKKFRIKLASGSPRRRQLLEELGLEFEVVTREYPEIFPDNLKGKDIAEYLSREKANLWKEEITENEIVITADTIVWCDGTVLGKPDSRDEAIKMIEILSGNIHEVITGVTFISKEKERTFSETTKVTFGFLTSEEIRYYVENFEPYDKAGAYGIQEWIGLAGCTRIEGSYFNVVGLPVQMLYRELLDFVKNMDLV